MLNLRTSSERGFANADHSAGNCDGSQASTFIECPFFNAGNAFRDNDLSQSCAFSECGFPDVVYCAGYCHASQTSTTTERTAPDAGYITAINFGRDIRSTTMTSIACY